MAKGLAVICMIQVHLTELFAQPKICEGLFGRMSLFLGGPVVAPTFMAILGYLLGATYRPTARLLARGVRLLLLGMLLNIGLNVNLLTRVYRGDLNGAWPEYLLGADILFLAGISVIAIALLRIVLGRLVLGRSGLAYVAAAFLVLVATPWVTSSLTVGTSVRYLYAYIGGHYRWSYFPVFPWLAYPLLGYAFSLLKDRLPLRRTATQRTRMTTIVVLGVSLACTGGHAWRVCGDLQRYYHHGPLFCAWTTIFLAFWVLLLSEAEADFGQTSPARYAKWLGRNVTTVYVIQWLLIGNLATEIYRTQTLTQLALWWVIVPATASALTYIWLKTRVSWKAPVGWRV